MTIAPEIEIAIAELAELCQHYQVRELSLFGSAARGEMAPGSDIDLLVEFLPGHRMGLFEFLELQARLTAVLGRRVDLVSKRGLKPRVRPEVLRDAKLLYAA
jgi:uncharacterized protein